MRRQLRRDDGQTVILVAIALPLIVVMIALVIDGAHWFTQRRSVQNAADAAALALARDIPRDGSACTGACLSTMVADAQTYATANGMSVTVHSCSGAADTNCVQTPYSGSTGTKPNPDSSVQVRLRKNASTFFAQAFALSVPVGASAAVALGGPPSSAGKVTPIGVDQTIVCHSGDTVCFSTPHVLDFQSPPGFSLLDLDKVSTSGPIVGNTASTAEMVTWIDEGYPALLPAKAWYGAEGNAGGHNGMKSSLENAAASQTVLLVPVFGQPSGGATSPDPATGSYYVIGFAAFLIDPGGVVWRGNGVTGRHTLTGKFVDYIATGVSGGPPGGSNDFGVHVITLDE